jgi:Na+:H+ antiporter
VIGNAAPNLLVVFVAFLVALPVVVFAARRLRLPYTVVLVVLGLIAAALPFHDSLQVTPSLAVTLLLPGLVFEAAYRLDGEELRCLRSPAS